MVMVMVIKEVKGLEEVYHLAGSVTVIRDVFKVLKMNVS